MTGNKRYNTEGNGTWSELGQAEAIFMDLFMMIQNNVDYIDSNFVHYFDSKYFI
jgi:hypothetical protein